MNGRVEVVELLLYNGIYDRIEVQNPRINQMLRDYEQSKEYKWKTRRDVIHIHNEGHLPFKGLNKNIFKTIIKKYF